MVVMFTLFLLGQHVANSFSPSPIAVRASTYAPYLTFFVWSSARLSVGWMVGRRVAATERRTGGCGGGHDGGNGAVHHPHDARVAAVV